MNPPAAFKIIFNDCNTTDNSGMMLVCLTGM